LDLNLGRLTAIFNREYLENGKSQRQRQLELITSAQRYLNGSDRAMHRVIEFS